jgi:hypothetical protein
MDEPRSVRALAVQVLDWAESRDTVEDPYVASLLESLETEQGLDLQQDLNPLDYLPIPSTPGGDRRLLFSNFLTIVRNVLVFVPVAITWKAVAEATAAFGRFTEENSATTVNFLQFWENGYGYLDPFWGIANIAQIDFLVILAIITLTLFIGYLMNSAQEVKTRNARVIDLERLNLALEIRKVLRAHRQVEPANVSSETQQAIQDLSLLARDLVNVAGTMHMTSRELGANRQAVEELSMRAIAAQDAWAAEVAQQLQLLSAGVQDSGHQLESSMTSLAHMATELRESLAGSLRQSLEESTHAFREVASQVQDSGRALNANSQVLQEDMIDLHRRLQRLLSDGTT